MIGKIVEKVLWTLLVFGILVSIGFLYIKYIIQHDYEILYLTPEEREEFLIEMAEEEGVEIPVEETSSEGEMLESAETPESGLESDLEVPTEASEEDSAPSEEVSPTTE